MPPGTDLAGRHRCHAFCSATSSTLQPVDTYTHEEKMIRRDGLIHLLAAICKHSAFKGARVRETIFVLFLTAMCIPPSSACACLCFPVSSTSIVMDWFSG
eukprot:scaffold107124_cov14-Tisochrysis_lutea.AAC.1